MAKMTDIVRLCVVVQCFVFIFGEGNAATTGTRFILPFSNDTTMSLLITTSSLTSLGVIVIVDETIFQETVVYGLPATVRLPTSLDNGHVTVDSSGEVTLVAMIGDHEPATFLVLPVGGLGTWYFLPTCDSQNATIGLSTVAGDSTIVAVAVSSAARSLQYKGASYSNGQIITTTLAPNETVFFYSSGDVARTFIIASNPVAVVIRCDVKLSQNTSSYMAEMPLPFKLWDTAFVVVPFSINDSLGERYGILAGLPGATVVISGSSETTYELEPQDCLILNNTDEVPLYITSSDPIYISLYSVSDNASISMQSILGVSQWANSYTISPPSGSSTNFITILAEASATAGIVTTDRLLVGATWIPVSGTNYSRVTVQYTGDFIYVGTVNCSDRFGVFAHGFYDNSTSGSYGYPAGMIFHSESGNISETCDDAILDLITADSVNELDASDPTSIDVGSDPSSSFTETSGLESKSFAPTPETSPASDSSPSPQTTDLYPSSPFCWHATSTDVPVLSNVGSPLDVSTGPEPLLPSPTLTTPNEKGESALPTSDTDALDLSLHPLSHLQQTLSRAAQEESFLLASPASLLTSFHGSFGTSTLTSSVASYTFQMAEPSSKAMQSPGTDASPKTESSGPLTTLYTFVAATAAVPVFAVLLVLGLWIGVTKYRASAKCSLQVDDANTRKFSVTKVKRIVVTPHDSPRQPARVEVLNKQTTLTSLRCQSLDF